MEEKEREIGTTLGNILLSKYAGKKPSRRCLLICAAKVLPRPHAKLLVRPFARVQTEDHAGVHGEAGKRRRGVRDEADRGKGVRADDEQGVHELEAQDRVGQERPDVLGHGLDEHGVEVRVRAVAPAGRQDDDPEEGWAGVVAVIGVLAPEDGNKGIEAFEEPVFLKTEQTTKTQ